MGLNVQDLQGQWNQLKGQLKEKWGELSDDDLAWSGGNIDQLVGRIQQRTGETRESIERFLGRLTSEGGSMIAGAAEAAGSYVQDVSHRLRDHYGSMAERAQEGFVSARESVAHRPMQWIGIAFGVGLAAGVLTGLSLGGSSRRRSA